MSASGRPAICYVVPGHDLLSSVGPSRNVLNLARALQPWADVTVAFRRVAEERRPEGIPVLEIDPGDATGKIDDAAMRGIGYLEFLRFMRVLRRFVTTELASFDIVLEKSWLLSGYVSSLCRRRGQLGVPIENIVVDPNHASRGQFAKMLRLRAGHWIAGRAIRGAPLVIAETEFLKREIAQHWRVAEDRIAVVDLGVDRTLFRPIAQAEARARLGIDPAKTVLGYVGVLDFTHDLEPAIRALAMKPRPNLELHLVGDGVRRAEFERIMASTGAPIVFHGRVEHHEVPVHIAAADLCLAPYDAAAFSSGELGYSTMKIPEYLGVGRPVVSVATGRIRTLVRDGETGFLFPNEQARWAAFLDALPDRARLAEMGVAAAATMLTSWEDTARAYLALCERELRKSADTRR